MSKAKTKLKAIMIGMAIIAIILSIFMVVVDFKMGNWKGVISNLIDISILVLIIISEEKGTFK